MRKLTIYWPSHTSRELEKTIRMRFGITAGTTERTKEMTFDLFRQVVWSDDDFMVIADYTPQWPQYTVYERITMQSIGTTNCNYYMGQVRQIIHMHKKRFEELIKQQS